MLRAGGTEVYDQWISHEIPFDDPAIARAMATFGEVVFGAGFVAGGPESVARTSPFEAHDQMLDDPPGCWLSHGASYFDEFVRDDAVAGVDYDFFALPPLAPGETAPVFGEATLLGAVSDRPEVREFLRMVMDSDAVPAWGAAADDVFIPATAGVESRQCTSPGEPGVEANAVRVRMCEAARDAVANDRFRLDASDSMPPEIGLPAAEPGAFVEGMLDYVTGGPGSLDAVLSRIEEGWPA